MSKKENIFASAGSCQNEVFKVYGTVNGITFTSDCFTGTMNSQKFWDDLKEYAKAINKFVVLIY